MTPETTVSASLPPATELGRRAASLVFLAFAFAYFLSALIRAITATLAPTLTQEFALQARDLGLLAGGYFLGFSLTQLPLGTWLDRHGPKRVILCFLAVAVVGCLAFSVATSFSGLLAARVLCGVGVSACLMAPLTGYRRWFAPAAQLRGNSDADDRFTGHGCFHFACSMADAGHRLAPLVLGAVTICLAGHGGHRLAGSALGYCAELD